MRNGGRGPGAVLGYDVRIWVLRTSETQAKQQKSALKASVGRVPCPVFLYIKMFHLTTAGGAFLSTPICGTCVPVTTALQLPTSNCIRGDLASLLLHCRATFAVVFPYLWAY